MRITGRDIELFKAINDFQCLTKEQIAKLFAMNHKVCERRLRKLCSHGYLDKRPVPTTNPGKPPFLYYPGQNTTAYGFPVSKRPRLTLQLSHQQKNTDIMIDFILQIKKEEIGYGVLPEHLIRTAEQEIIPDGAILLKRNNKTALLMLENCSGTEIIKSDSYHDDIENKIIRYSEMFENSTIRFYEDHFETKLERFRLLYITNNRYRLNSIAEVVKKYNEHGFFWMTTLGEFCSNGLKGKIWTIPGEIETQFNQAIVK